MSRTAEHLRAGRLLSVVEEPGAALCGAAGSGRALLAGVHAWATPATLTPDSAALPVGVSAAPHVRDRELLAGALLVGGNAAMFAAGAGACARPPAFVTPPPPQV